MATTIAAEARKQKITGKTPATRLLDLLAGWCDFVSADEENDVRDTALSSMESGDLYQMAGALSLEWEESSADERDRAVAAFVEERILPLLLRKDKAAA